jgi:Glycosyl hydrolase 108
MMEEQNKYLFGFGILGCLAVGLYFVIKGQQPKDKSGNPVIPVKGSDPTGESGEGTREEFDVYCDYILNKWESVHVETKYENSKYAICKEWYPDENIAELDINHAMDLIYRDYWLKYNIHLLPKYLRMLVLDCAINQGQPTSIRLLQKCAGVTIDGHNGTITQNAAKNVTIKMYYDARMEQYKASAKGDRAQYLAGWMNRLKDVYDECQK